MKRKYVTPSISLEEIQVKSILGNSTENITYDPNDGTYEALSNEGSLWDDYSQSNTQSILDE